MDNIMNRKISRIRSLDWIIFFLIFVAFYCFFTSGESENSTWDDEESAAKIQIDSRKEDIREMCQFLEHEYRGIEGDQWLKGNDYEKKIKLRGMAVTFRHGERSPISKVEDQLGCLPALEEDRKRFKEYTKLADSDDVINFLKIDPIMTSFHRYPEYSNCVSGNLTAEGALQHVKLGKYFREKYSTSYLFKNENQRIVTEVSTSQFYRTLQSVLAFSTEFLYKQRDSIAPIVIKAANSTSQCLHEFCDCPVLRQMRYRYEEEHLAEFNKMTSDPVKKETEEVMRTFEDFKNSPDPFKIIDVALGKYVCRRRNLPCVGEKCITIDYLNKVIELATKRGKSMFENNIGIAKRLQIEESYPIIMYLKKMLEKIRRFPHSNYIRIFSAHDSVVGPLLRTLGIPFVDPPHYTSRLVFEIYEHVDEGLYIRFLYNGQNRSEDVRFCKGNNLKYGMCRATAFEQFINNGIFELIGVKNFREACHL